MYQTIYTFGYYFHPAGKLSELNNDNVGTDMQEACLSFQGMLWLWLEPQNSLGKQPS